MKKIVVPYERIEALKFHCFNKLKEASGSHYVIKMKKNQEEIIGVELDPNFAYSFAFLKEYIDDKIKYLKDKIVNTKVFLEISLYFFLKFVLLFLKKKRCFVMQETWGKELKQ